jgi:broad specificity phosphatase PhoE
MMIAVVIGGGNVNMIRLKQSSCPRRSVIVQRFFILLLALTTTNVLPINTYAFQIILQNDKNSKVEITNNINVENQYRGQTRKTFSTRKAIRKQTGTRKAIRSDAYQHQTQKDDEEYEGLVHQNTIHHHILPTRRDVVVQSSSNTIRFLTSFSLVGTYIQQQQQPAFAAFAQQQVASDLSLSSSTLLLPDTDCLQDLPLLDKTKFVRLFLCRHGETDNNRLQKIQGVRLNPSINDLGMKQAYALGQTLALCNTPPELYYSSSLLRAKVTASIAHSSATAVNTNKHPELVTEPVPSLMEIDFGPIAEGVPVEEVRGKMIATYGQWAMGNINARMDEDGESGFEVLQRIENALSYLVSEALKTKSGSIAAVAHSVYLRVLLSSIGQTDGHVTITSPSNLKQKNCCINVIDFPRTYVGTSTISRNSENKTTPVSRREAGFFSQLTKSKETITAQGKIIRIN